MWNYRGYGQSTGKPTITNSQSDAFSVFMHYKKLNYDIKLVHGYSIGGTSAIGMMTKLSQSSLPEEEIKKVEVLIVDRSFSSIGEVSKITFRCPFNLETHFINSPKSYFLETIWIYQNSSKI